MNLLLRTFTPFVLSVSELIITYIYSICFVYQWTYYYVRSLHLFCLSMNLLLRLLRTFTPFVLCISELISTSFTSFVLSISELIITYIYCICFVYQWTYYYVHSLHLFCVSVNLLVRHSLHLFCLSVNLLLRTFTSFVLSVSELIITYIHSICFVYQWTY